MFAISVGLLTAVAFLIICMRIGMRKVMGYPLLADATATLLMAYIYMGTFGGMTTAIVGGLAFSAAVSIIRKYFGYSRYSFRKRQWVTTAGVLSNYSSEGLKSCLNLNWLNLWPLLIAALLLLLIAA